MEAVYFFETLRFTDESVQCQLSDIVVLDVIRIPCVYLRLVLRNLYIY
jgi:hypothetical protein